tara:strand:- start:829 stop:972 length:144 start_codon:yes stop_codon:yes gene_type:complete
VKKIGGLIPKVYGMSMQVKKKVIKTPAKKAKKPETVVAASLTKEKVQ